jgi:hypothetical protein
MRLVTRSELARHAGCTSVAVTLACKGRLKDAVRGNRVDLDHPKVQAWLKKRGREAPAPPPSEVLPAQLAPAPGPRGAQTAPVRTPEGIEDIHGFEDLTLREIVARYGSMSVHSDWLDMRRKQTQIREREIKNHELEGKLIPREAVRVHVFGLIDGAFRRLLQDSPKTIARRVYAMARAGEPVEKAEELVRDSISSLLRPLKDGAARVLRAGSAPRGGTTE